MWDSSSDDRSSSQVSPVDKQFGFVAAWANTLNANGDLTDALRYLAQLLRADAVKLIRSQKQNAAMRIVARCDVEDGRIYCTSSREVLGDAILSDEQFCARQGSIWALSEAVSPDRGANGRVLAQRAARMSVREVLVVVLSSDKSCADFLEIHFRHEPLQHNLNLLTMLSRTIAKSWAKRRPGLVSIQIQNNRPRVVGDAAGPGDVPILDISNPMSLSRSEYRVATMLHEGMTAKTIASALSVCEATVRSHLSAIYSKVGASGQVELLHRLNCHYGGVKLCAALPVNRLR